MLNVLYIFFPEAVVDLSSVEGKCTVVHSDNISQYNCTNMDSYFLGGPDRFCFSEVTKHSFMIVYFKKNFS